MPDASEQKTEEHKRQMVQMFNLTEVPLMEFITQFLEEERCAQQFYLA